MILTASTLAAAKGVHIATARGWLADPSGSLGGYPIVATTATVGKGARRPVRGVDVPDAVVAQWREELG